MFKAKVTATVEMIVWLREDQVGNVELEEVEEVIEVEEFENIRPI